MELLTRSQLHQLTKLEASLCVSIYFPAIGASQSDRPDRLRLANLLRQATIELRARGLSEREADELLAPAAALAGDETFWAAPAGGVALFAAPGFFRRVRVDFALPEAVRVASRFSVRPLLPIVERTERFAILAVSLKRVRLLDATSAGCHEARPAGLPASYQEAMGYVEYDSAVSVHSASTSALGRRAPIVHGHGDDDEENFEADLEHFCQRVVAPVRTAFAGLDVPVVLASVAEYLPFLRRAGAGLELADEAIVGNPDRLADAELVAAARERLESARERSLDAELVRWNELRGGRGFEDLEEIVRSADRGRIETLFVAREAERWGSYEPDLGRVLVHAPAEPGDEELLDFAVTRTLAQRGEAHELPLAAMPEGRVAVAILRWARAA